ncbi:MAG: HAMP domain-containing protein, partial [Mariprofundaceae bacterium]|nr:HAMP domain-containing protein [Mariprofundaceae bacterium]
MKSLGTRIALVISAVLFCMMLVAGFVIDRQLTRSFHEENLSHAQVYARSLLASLRTLMLNGQGTLARKWLDNMREAEGVLDIAVLRRDGSEAFMDLETVNAVNAYLRKNPAFWQELIRNSDAVISPPARAEEYFFRKEILPPRRVASTAALQRALQGETSFDRLDAAGLTIYMPIDSSRECLACHGYDKTARRGVLKLSLSTLQVSRQIGAMRRNLWTAALALVLLLGVILWLALRYSVIRPIGQLRDAITQVGRAERGSKLPINRSDELGQVSRVFNQMKDRLFR